MSKDFLNWLALSSVDIHRPFGFLRTRKVSPDSPGKPTRLTTPKVLGQAVAAQVDDSPGWGALSSRPHDYDAAQVQEIYQDALTAWRKNPIAWRIVAIISDYVVGGQITPTSTVRALEKFIQVFWNHPKNNMPLRLESMCDELSRAGDLFVLLFRNPQDGMSYIRLLTKDQITRIETAPNDWETELVYHQIQEGTTETRRWYGPDHPEAAYQDAICLHYAINRPAGALLGESDLVTMLPWLLRYSRMLEDRVRLHWALRAYLWIVTVPAQKVREKQEFYRTPPEPGSVVIKDESEKWEILNPNLHGADARHDMQAVRAMIDAGSGFPPHWRGDAGDISLATAQAMQGPTERHLARRQRYFAWMLQDILYHAYHRASQIGLQRTLPRSRATYEHLFTVNLPDISRVDNEPLARSARDLTQAFYTLASQLPALTPTLARRALRMAVKFAGETITEEEIDAILGEISGQPLAVSIPRPLDEQIIAQDDPNQKPPSSTQEENRQDSPEA